MTRFGVSGGFIRRHRTALASWSALAVVAAGVVAYAAHAQPYPVHHPDLDDGGIWVISRDQGLLGRQNRPVAELDATVVPGGGRTSTEQPGLDVLQNGAAVVAVDTSADTATPVDVVDAKTDSGGAATYAHGGQVAAGGDVVAADDPTTGKLWVGTDDPETGEAALASLDPKSTPVGVAGPDAALAVGTDGTAYELSGQTRTLVTVPPGGAAATSTFGAAPAGKLSELTAVGDQVAYLDAQGRVGVGTATTTVGQGARLQQSGAAASSVLAGTAGGLVAVDLASGSQTTLTRQGGVPSQPVRLGSCVYGAWLDTASETATVRFGCDGGAFQTGTISGITSPVQDGDSPLVFRVNRGQIVISDIQTGLTWPIHAGQLRNIADWQSFTASPRQHDRSHDHHTVAQQARKPVAKDDRLGARAGAETVLHVLDNDTSMPGRILTIDSGFTGPSSTGVSVQLAPDHQSLLAQVQPGVPTESVDFTYRISDGTNVSDPATVHLTVHGQNQDRQYAAPRLRPHAPKIVYPVSVGASVSIPVLTDWRDYAYGDPVTVQDPKVVSGGGSVSLASDGELTYTAGARAGLVRVRYEATTGGRPTAGTVAVKVLAGNDRAAPTAEDDLATGVIVDGTAPTVTVRPLDNDIPGADPQQPSARLALGGVHVIGSGPQATYDPDTGVVSVPVTRPGSYDYSYTATFGDAPVATGHIRVVVDTARSAQPIAVGDTATLTGDQPRIVDVLANDYDPLGRVLVVQHAEPVRPDSGLRVAVVDDHWLEISASGELSPSRQSVSYTMSAGDGTEATGTVTVTQKPDDAADDRPQTVDDDVVVRAGDSVSVPVLDNDSVPSGAPLGLLGSGHGDPPVESNAGHDPNQVGTAHLDGQRIRYVAPASVDGPLTVQVPYTAVNTAAPAYTATGLVVVTVLPKPDTIADDQPPTPPVLEGRVVQGDTVVLQLPTTGLDPDGDSVSITALGDPGSTSQRDTEPQLGTVLSYGANSITYQAFPDSTGTDTFSYVLTDTYGQSSVGVVRVGVVAPSVPQSPVAVDDSVTVAPGRTLTYNVLANDIKAPGTPVTLDPIEPAVAGVSADAQSGVVTVHTSPDAKAQTSISYTISGGLQTSAPATLAVSYRPGYDNPPVAGTVVARPTGAATRVKVDLAAKVTDIDDPVDKLRIHNVRSPDATGDAETSAQVAPDGSVTLPVGPVPTVWTYEVTDPSGQSAAGTIYVPRTPSGAPYLKPGAEIDLKQGQSKTVHLSDLVVDAKPVHLTSADAIVPAPDGLFRKTGQTGTSIDLTAGPVAGKGTLTFEVSDGPTTDPKAHVVVLTVPVVVGNPPPVINCPPAQDPVDVVNDGGPTHVNIAGICHVWTADPAAAASLSFTAGGSTLRGVGVQATGTAVDLTAHGVPGMPTCPADAESAYPVGSLSIGVKGRSDAHAGTLHYRVTCLPPPTLSPVPAYQTMTSDKPLVIDLAPYIVTPGGVQDVHKVVTATKPLNGGPTLAVQQGSSSVTFENPGAGHHGKFRYEVTVSDADGDSGRTATGIVEVDLTDYPAAPTGLAWQNTSKSDFISGYVDLNWNTPKDDGGDPDGIDYYQVNVTGLDNGGHSQVQCQSSPCKVATPGNGRFSFQVFAHNTVGLSRAGSNTAQGYAGEIPDGVTRLRLVSVANHKVTLSWNPPDCQSSGHCDPMTKYVVSSSLGTTTVHPAAGAVTASVAGDNDAGVVYTVTAYNDVAEKFPIAVGSQTMTDAIQSAGQPATPQISATQTSFPAQSDPSAKVVHLVWSAVDPNGPGTATYQVYKDGTPLAQCSWIAATSCDDTLDNNGARHTYTVRARNEEATSSRVSSGVESAASFTSKPSAGYAVEAAGTPDAVTINSMQPTGQDGAATVAFTAGASHGSTSTVRCFVGSSTGPSCGTQQGSPSGFSGQFAVTGLTNGQLATVYLVDDNGNGGGHGAGSRTGSYASAQTTPYGPIGTVQLSASASAKTVSWSASVNPNGKAVSVVVRDNAGHEWSTTTGTGAASYTGSFAEADYATTYQLTVTVTDTSGTGPTRATKTATASAKTGPAPPPPAPSPPPAPAPSVTLSHGSPDQSSDCSGSSCAFVMTKTANFSGNVTCHFTQASGPGGASRFATWSQGPNVTTDSGGAFYGYNGTTIAASCTDGTHTKTGSLTW